MPTVAHDIRLAPVKLSRDGPPCECDACVTERVHMRRGVAETGCIGRYCTSRRNGFVPGATDRMQQAPTWPEKKQRRFAAAFEAIGRLLARR